MKVGDLVTLSAYGKKVKRTGWIKDGDIGIIQELRTHHPGWTEYAVLWMKSKFEWGRYWHHQPNFDRRDLKHVRPKKRSEK